MGSPIFMLLIIGIPQIEHDSLSPWSPPFLAMYLFDLSLHYILRRRFTQPLFFRSARTNIDDPLYTGTCKCPIREVFFYSDSIFFIPSIASIPIFPILIFKVKRSITINFNVLGYSLSSSCCLQLYPIRPKISCILWAWVLVLLIFLLLYLHYCLSLYRFIFHDYYLFFLYHRFLLSLYQTVIIQSIPTLLPNYLLPLVWREEPNSFR